MIYACVSVCVCVMEYYLAIKSEIVSFVIMWMYFENFMLSEINQKKLQTLWYHLYVLSKKYEKEKNKTQAHGYTEWMVAWAKGSGISKMGERDQNIQIYS